MTSRDILVKNLKKADAKLKFWKEEREKAMAMLEKFDQEKKDALVKDLQRHLKEEKWRRSLRKERAGETVERL